MRTPTPTETHPALEPKVYGITDEERESEQRRIIDVVYGGDEDAYRESLRRCRDKIEQGEGTPPDGQCMLPQDNGMSETFDRLCTRATTKAHRNQRRKSR